VRYRNASSLAATFLERYRENGRVVRVEAGNAYFLHPGKMRWDYEAPEKNTFLVDGKYVWFYSPGDHAVTRMPAKKSEDWRTPLAFLTSGMKLSRICAQVEPARDLKPSQANGLVYRCTLHESQDSASSPARPALLELSPEGELNRIVIPQGGGIELEFSFAHWRWNPTLDKAVFQFVPPRDTVIVNGLLPDTPGLRQ
jgi:outer membrane lipoprotein carrier protein